MLLVVILSVDEINAFINNLIPSLSKHIVTSVPSSLSEWSTTDYNRFSLCVHVFIQCIIA